MKMNTIIVAVVVIGVAIALYTVWKKQKDQQLLAQGGLKVAA